MNPVTESAERLVVALLIGFLIGLDRERAEVRKARRLFAGVRTFPLIALAGAIPVLLIESIGSGLLVASFIAVASLTIAAYMKSFSAGQIGATTEFAALVTFLLGALAGAGELLLAGSAGIVVAVLLVAKPRLEAFSRALTEEELSAVLELAVISGIVLPLLPNQNYGPWQLFNPFDIWLVVVLVSGLSFAGFVAMRAFGGGRGMLLAGVLGALVSSTAVTAAMANRSREDRGLARVAASAAILASAVMCLRVAAFAAGAGPGILPLLAPVIATMTVAGVVAAWWLLRGSGTAGAQSDATPIGNPFSLVAAATFAILYALVLLIVKVTQEYLGSIGVYLGAALSALVDVDAVTIALVRSGPDASGWGVPATAVAVAMIANTVVKLGIAVSLGEGSFRRYVAVSLGVMAGCGILTAIAVPILVG